MADYEKMYHIMFNAATDAERHIAKAVSLLEISKPLTSEMAAMTFMEAQEDLIVAQQRCEEIYVDSGCCLEIAEAE